MREKELGVDEMRSHVAASHQNSSGNEKLLALVSGLQSPTSSRSRRRAAQKKIVATPTAKCSSSRSLYYVDSNEFDSGSSRLDVVRRRASNNLYKAEFQQPSRRSRHVAVKKPKHAASSSLAPKSPAPPPLCVETAARRNAAEQELIMRPEKNKLELEEEEVADAHHCDSSLEEEVEEFPVSRRPSGRTHLSEAAAFVVPGKIWSSSLRAMGRYNENVSAKSNDFASAAPRGYLDTSPASLPDHLLPSLEASVPFQWEEAPGKPKTTTATAAEQKTCKVRSLSRQGIELNSFVEAVDVHFQTTAAEGAGPAPAAMQDPQQSDSRRNVEEQEFAGSGPVAQLLSRRSSGDQAVGECSHRYYGKSSSGSTTGARSSSGCLQLPQEKETRIDLVAPAAAKFLVQEMSCYLSPLTTPPHDHHHAATFASSPAAVPFKWEETPGKPKLADDAASKLPHHHTLQLPPRLISTPQPRAAGLGSSSSFSGRGGHQHSLVGGPLSGFFSPCRMNASSPHRAGHATVHSSSSFRGSKSLPKADVFENSPLQRKINRSAFSAPLAATTTSASAAGLQPPSLYNSSPSTSELKAMMMMSSSSPTSTLDHGPETESLSQTSASKSSFSGYLDACARPAATSTRPFTTTFSHAHSSKSSSSSRASYESVEQEFDHVELATTTRSCSSLSYNSLQERGGCNGGHDFSSSSSLRNLGPGSTQQQDKDQSTHRGGGPRLGSSSTSEAVKALIIKLCRGGGNCFNTQPKSSSTTSSNTKPLQYLEVEAAPTLRTTCSSIQYCNMELNPNLSFVLDPSNRQLDEHASYHEYTTQKKIVVQDHQASKPLQASLPIPNTMHSCRLLPYDTMPLPSLEVEQEELATVTRDHLPHQPPKTDFTASVCAAATVKQHTPGEIFSLQRCNALERSKSPSTKFQQGVHFIFSMCYKALKQVLFRQQPQQRRKLVVVEPKPLWYHHDDIPLTEFQFVKYGIEVMEKVQAKGHVPSVIAAPAYYLLHIVREGITFLACARSEMSPLLGIEGCLMWDPLMRKFLGRVADVLSDYLGGLNDDLIKDNFVIVYQLLDEMMDSGFPMTTEPNILKEIIVPPNLVSRVISVVTGGASSMGRILPSATSSNVRWRASGIKHANNEIYFDLMEEMDATVNRDGFLARCEVYGEVRATSRLSGMPDVTVTFTNPSILNDVSFHPCVRYKSWEANQKLSFVPPDGSFKLMSYRVKNLKNTPIYVKPQLSSGEGVVTVNVMVGIRADPGKPVDSIVVQLPLPPAVASSDLSANHGTVTHNHNTKISTWNIGRIPKDKAPCLTGKLHLAKGLDRLHEYPTLLVGFKIMGVALSGFRNDKVDIEHVDYRSFKGFRALTRAACYEIRT